MIEFESTPTDRILQLLQDGGAESYLGEPVTQLAHALQTAALAAAAGAGDALVIAALLHDIGHLVEVDGEHLAAPGIDGGHEHLGHQCLQNYIGPDVTEPIRLHVEAKRYLCAVEPGYLASLSPASRESLSLQGGPMTADEVRTYESTPWSKEATQLRRWDDAAKTPGLEVPGWWEYRDRLRRVIAR